MYYVDKRDKLEPLTEIEKATAEQYHNWIYVFLHEHQYSIEDFYDIAAIGYLKGIQKYMRTPELHTKCSMATVCIYRMKAEIQHHQNKMNTLKRKPANGIISLDANYSKHDSDMTLADCIGTTPFEDDVLDNEVVSEILNSLSESQRQIIAMKLNGYTHNEIHLHLNISMGNVTKELKEIKNILTDRCGC